MLRVLTVTAFVVGVLIVPVATNAHHKGGSWIGPVTASWYGPGFYGNTTACGHTYTGGELGVAHKSLPCGYHLRLRRGTRVVKVRVIDRGPYARGRTFDMTPRVKRLLHCGSLCHVHYKRHWR